VTARTGSTRIAGGAARPVDDEDVIGSGTSRPSGSMGGLWPALWNERGWDHNQPESPRPLAWIPVPRPQPARKPAPRSRTLSGISSLVPRSTARYPLAGSPSRDSPASRLRRSARPRLSLRSSLAPLESRSARIVPAAAHATASHGSLRSPFEHTVPLPSVAAPGPRPFIPPEDGPACLAAHRFASPRLSLRSSLALGRLGGTRHVGCGGSDTVRNLPSTVPIGTCSAQCSSEPAQLSVVPTPGGMKGRTLRAGAAGTL